MSSREWMDSALCAQTDPELWFPDNGGNYRPAHRICARCPVRVECAEYAEDIERGLSHPYRHGAWAGTTPRARASARTESAAQVRDDKIRRLTEAGWAATSIADHLGCTDRTVWRVLAEQRKHLGEAA